jgi:CheY-like chemotaxis protein
MLFLELEKFSVFAKNKKVEYNAVFLNDVIEEVITQSKYLWSNFAQRDGISFSIMNLIEEKIVVWGDYYDLVSALFNIIKNAIEAMPKGGTITIQAQINTENEQVVLDITDTGLGMDDDTKKRIFQPFFTTKGLELGRGLGLSSVFGIIKSHNGQIFVKDTSIGAGTVFEIVLPLCNMKNLELEKGDVENEEIFFAVLWVDDEPEILKPSKMMLERMGHRADIANSAHQALEILQNNQYDLLITDIGMPEMNGWQLIDAIRGKYDNMKIVIISGWGSDISPEKMQEHGVNYVLEKPISKKNLISLFEEIF